MRDALRIAFVGFTSLALTACAVGPMRAPPSAAEAASICDGWRAGYENPASTPANKQFIIREMKKLNCTNIPQ